MTATNSPDYAADVVARKPAAVCPHCHKPVKALPITWRMMEVLQGILAQKTTKEIAYEMGISVVTAESNRTKLFRAAGVENVVGLVKWALEEGFTFADVEPEPSRKL